MAANWPTAGDLMTAEPLTVPPDAPLSRALGIMRTRGVHELPVLRGNRLLGMIMFESIARRTNLPLMTKVQHLMVLPPLITAATQFPEIAEHLLAAGMRAAPVVGKKGELIGVVSRTDLVRAMSALPLMSERRVEEIASPVGTLIRETELTSRLFAQIRLLEEHPLPVIDRKGKLVGAVGIADLGRVLWRPVVGGKRDVRAGRSILSVEVGTIMHSPAITIEPGATSGEASQRMTEEKVSSVFVVENGKPIGVVSQVDLLGLAVGSGLAVPEEGVGDVYVQVHGLRGSGDPEVLTEIDRIVAKGLRHISRHVHPRLLSLNITPQGTHRSGDAAVQVRLHADEGTFYASQTGWNFYAGIADLMEELAEQTQRAQAGRRRTRRAKVRGLPTDEEPADPEVEEKIRAATAPEDE
ncbi:MAG: CBS domain-containing protein [Thermoplasmata archaeon]|jgi:CBS-domain-containing membrane protein